MDSFSGILLLTTEPETERRVAAALSSERGLGMGPTCHSFQELAARLRQQPPKAVVVDLDPAPEKTLALLDPLISRYGEVKFVVLAQSPGQQLLLEAMHVGARHVVPKESLQTELPVVLRRFALNGAAKHAPRGYIVTVLSSGGGCGATLLAVNLANELRTIGTGSALLIDMDVYSGAVSSYLNVHAQYDLSTVLSDGDRIDAELVKSSSALYDQKLYVLLSPVASIARATSSVRFEHLPRLLWAAKDAFDYTVIDAPRLPLELSVQLASASSLTMVPFQLTVVGIRAAKALMNSLVEQGVPADQIMPIASRYHKRRALISLAEAARALGREQVGALTNDYKASVTSNNMGQPLERAARRSAIRRDIERLAQHVNKAHVGSTPVSPVF
jgi:pilus assembly protein CpaE